MFYSATQKYTNHQTHWQGTANVLPMRFYPTRFLLVIPFFPFSFFSFVLPFADISTEFLAEINIFLNLYRLKT